MKEHDARVAVFDAAYDASMDQVVAEIFMRFPLVIEGKSVLVKPNILSPHPPQKAVTTHPTLVRAVVNYLREMGSRIMVGDNPGVFGYGMSEKAARVSGIYDAAQGFFIQLGRSPVRHKLTSRVLDHVMIARDVLEADIVINLPKLKTHGLTFYSGAIKNTFGYVTGGDKLRVHSAAQTPRRFAEALVDIYRIRPPDLTIMDGVDAMEGNGPSNGTIRKIGKVLAAPNGVTLDAAALVLIGRTVKSVPHVDIAGQRGLGKTAIAEIAIDGDLKPVIGFKMPATYVPGIAGIVLNRLLSRWLNCAPRIVQERCKQCGLCVKHCPVKSMRMEKAYPHARRDTCISCYCCQEMCPEDAIRLDGRLIGFIRRGALYGSRRQ